MKFYVYQNVNVTKYIRRENAKFIVSRCLLSSAPNALQESWAITKMTARCALYMGAMIIFESPWVHPRLRNFSMGFCSDRSYECAYKM